MPIKERLASTFVQSAAADILAAPGEREVLVQELRKNLIILASTMKHEAFVDEREVRWIASNWGPFESVHFPVTPRGFVPVLHVRSAGSTEGDPRLPVTGLRCSPTTAITIERTMRGVLDNYAYTAAAQDVVKSKLPFRG